MKEMLLMLKYRKFIQYLWLPTKNICSFFWGFRDQVGLATKRPHVL